ncbi:MAG: dTMP kinase [Methanomicrobiales archaeon]|jgi:dTMP kinase|nr:dTMP kinase [Methanomicrobiales archaeon]
MTLITIEGIDGVGKSTLHAELGRRLVDLDPLMTREPGGTEVGAVIREILKSKAYDDLSPYTEAFLFAADHAQHLHEIILPAMKANRLIISDRYYDSRLAYQQVTLAGVCEDPGLFLRSMHAGWTVFPTHTFLLILSPEKAYERSKHRGEVDRFEVLERLEQFHQAFLGLVEMDPSRFTLIDAELPFEEILSFVEEQVRDNFLRKN